MKFTNHDVTRWEDDAVTLRFRNLLKEMKHSHTQSLMSLNPDSSYELQRDYWLLRGAIDAFDIVLEADLMPKEES